MSAPPELAVESVTLRTGGLTVLDDVRFTVAPGSVHAVVGPAGAGKTSCADVISGLLRPSYGAVRYGEELITSLPARRRAGLGIGRSFQRAALTPDATVLDNVLLGRYARTTGGFLAAGLRLNRRDERRQAARAAELCAALGLGDRLDRPVARLPQAAAKRVDLARALAVEPTLLLLDEPTAGMAAEEAAELLAAVLRLCAERGGTVLVLAHELGPVADVADRVTLLAAGAVIADGPPGEVIADPAVRRAYAGAVAAEPAEVPS